jgi:hypothetical protein
MELSRHPIKFYYNEYEHTNTSSGQVISVLLTHVTSRTDHAHFTGTASIIIYYCNVALMMHLCSVLACNCDPEGSLDLQCNNNGGCSCKVMKKASLLSDRNTIKPTKAVTSVKQSPV